MNKFKKVVAVLLCCMILVNVRMECNVAAIVTRPIEENYISQRPAIMEPK